MTYGYSYGFVSQSRSGSEKREAQLRRFSGLDLLPALL